MNTTNDKVAFAIVSQATRDDARGKPYTSDEQRLDEEKNALVARQRELEGLASDLKKKWTAAKSRFKQQEAAEISAGRKKIIEELMAVTSNLTTLAQKRKRLNEQKSSLTEELAEMKATLKRIESIVAGLAAKAK